MDHTVSLPSHRAWQRCAEEAQWASDRQALEGGMIQTAVQLPVPFLAAIPSEGIVAPAISWVQQAEDD